MSLCSAFCHTVFITFYGTVYMSRYTHYVCESEYWMIQMLRCACAGSSNKVKTEADSDDISEHPRHDKPRPYLCTVCHKRFTQRRHLNVHCKKHTGENVCSCAVCEKRFSSPNTLYSHMNIHAGKYKCTE